MKNCKQIQFGSYDCYVQTKYGFDVDKCLIDEINKLNDFGIKTIGCCCGHDKKQGFIQVSPEYVNTMINLGYQQLPIDEHGNGLWCFKPKTIFD